MGANLLEGTIEFLPGDPKDKARSWTKSLWVLRRNRGEADSIVLARLGGPGLGRFYLRNGYTPGFYADLSKLYERNPAAQRIIKAVLDHKAIDSLIAIASPADVLANSTCSLRYASYAESATPRPLPNQRATERERLLAQIDSFPEGPTQALDAFRKAARAFEALLAEK